MSDNLFTIFRSRFPADLSKVFIARPDGSSLTYAELVDLSGRLANALTALGVKSGDSHPLEGIHPGQETGCEFGEPVRV